VNAYEPGDVRNATIILQEQLCMMVVVVPTTVETLDITLKLILLLILMLGKRMQIFEIC
jgi:hypothetical protein